MYFVLFVIQSFGNTIQLESKIQLKAYLSPKAKHKNILIFLKQSQHLQKQIDFHCSEKQKVGYKGL